MSEVQPTASQAQNQVPNLESWEEVAVKYWAKDGETRYSHIVDRVVKHLFKDSNPYRIDYKRASELAEETLRALTKREFMFNSPVFMNAGTELKSLAACFVLPLEDSMESIFGTVRNMALIMKEGGGVGISLSPLRAEGSPVKKTKGVSSGPVSFLKVYDSAVDTVKQGGTRRGAALANLLAEHRDIEKFIDCKSAEGAISNFNLSVALTDDFMSKAVLGGTTQAALLKKIAKGMWRNGEPGLQFIDTVNHLHLPYLRRPEFAQHNTGITTSNPCSEAFLKAFESCILGSINLYALCETPFWRGPAKFNWEKLKVMTRMAVDVLNLILDITVAPLPEINDHTSASRKIGIGIMGLADTLSAMGFSYDSIAGADFAANIMKTVTDEAESYSLRMGYKNSMLTLVAPTGTIATVANVSNGVEPHFRLLFDRNTIKAGTIKMVAASLSDFLNSIPHPDVKNEILAHLIENKGVFARDFRIKQFPLPLDVLWPNSNSVSPERHLAMLSALQQHTHNGISKTINLPENATENDCEKLIYAAWRSKVKGLTVYRDKSRDVQVLSEISSGEKDEKNQDNIEQADPHRTGNVPAESMAPTKRERPQRTTGQTTKARIGCGNLYVTTNRDARGPCEVFTSLGRGGGCPSQSEATARLTSLCLRSGIPASEVSEQLIGIKCMSTVANRSSGTLEDGRRVLSCPDAIGRCLQAFDTGGGDPACISCKCAANTESVSCPGSDREPVLGDSVGVRLPTGDRCPECSAPLRPSGGCRACTQCSYTKCG